MRCQRSCKQAPFTKGGFGYARARASGKQQNKPSNRRARARANPDSNKIQGTKKRKSVRETFLCGLRFLVCCLQHWKLDCRQRGSSTGRQSNATNRNHSKCYEMGLRRRSPNQRKQKQSENVLVLMTKLGITRMGRVS